MAKIKTRRYYIYYLAKIVFFIIGLIPRKISLFIADFLGERAFYLLKKYREIAITNLSFAFGEDNSEKIAKGVFRNLAKTGVDWIKLMTLKKEDIDALVTEVSGLEYLDDALARGKGVILFASHFGNWELLSIYLWANGYKGAVIARRLYFHKYTEFIEKLRNKFNAYVFYRDESPKKLLRILKGGDILGFLADQDIDSVDGIFVDFFGKPAFTPVAPVKLGMITEADMVPAFMIRKNDNTYKMVIEKPISLISGKDKEADVKKYTQAWTSVLENYIRKYPEQWVWVHRRWKRSAEEKVEVYS